MMSANGIALDDQGALYLAGYTGSSDFPVVDYVQGSIGGGTCGSAPCLDAFIAKLFPDGSSLIYSTYLGGEGNDYAWEVALDSQRTAHLVGSTSSGTFRPWIPFRN